MGAADCAVEELQAVVGSELRSVISYHSDGFKRVFMRDDLGPDALEERFERWHDRLMISQLGITDSEAAFDANLEVTMYCLDIATIVHIPQSPHTGVVITMERGADIGLEAIRGICRDFMH
ncbi:MAG: hypothetical protein ABEI76_04695 [Halobacteriales archaeon]